MFSPGIKMTCVAQACHLGGRFSDQKHRDSPTGRVANNTGIHSAILFWIAPIVVGGSLCAADSDSVDTALLDEYSKGLASLKSSIPYLVATAEVSLRHADPASNREPAEFQWAFRYVHTPLSMQVESSLIGGEPRVLVRSDSPVGVFEIGKHPKDQRFSLREAGGGSRPRIEAGLSLYLSTFLCGWYLFEDVEVLLADKSNRITSVTRREDGTVGIALDLDREKEPFQWLEFVVDPNLEWRIVRASCGSRFASPEVNPHYRQVQKDFTCQYSRSGKIIIPVEIRQEDYESLWSSADESLQKSWMKISAIKDYRIEPIPESQFLLSTFGLPDHVAQAPAAPLEDRNRSLYWLGFAALGVFLVTLSYWLAVRRRHAAQES